MERPADRTQFSTAVRLFLDACPGPPLLRQGLTIAAFQSVEGIPGLDGSQVQGSEESTAHAPGGHNIASTSPQDQAGGERYLGSVVAVGERLKLRPGYLSETAVRHGFSYSRALRWIRYFHGVTLLAQGHRVLEVALRLGFSDVAGWSRFTLRLVGKNPGQLPALPLEWWVRKAVDDVYFATRQ